MESTQTLHDFVLNLLTNADARSAFQLDPEGTLNEAGLGDITPADVQDVVPLVVDYTSVQGSASLAPVTGNAGLGVLDSDPTNVIAQLQAVTQQLAVGAQPTSADGNLAAAGTIAVDSNALGVGATGALGLGISGGVSADLTNPAGVLSGLPGVQTDPSGLSGTQDVAGTLDSEVLDAEAVEPGTADPTGAVGATVDGALGTVDGLAGTGLGEGLGGSGLVNGGLVDGGAVDGVLGTADSAVDPLTSPLGVDEGAAGTLPGVGSEDGPSLLGGVARPVDDALDSTGVGGVLDGGASVHSSTDAGAHGSTGTGGLPDATDILF